MLNLRTHKRINMPSILQEEGKYKLVNEISGYRLYVPVSIEEGYHLSRFIQIQRQSMYASSGATPDVLRKCMDAILDICNMNGQVKHRFSDISGIANMIKYRLDYPVDEHCSIRVGALSCFIEWDGADGAVVSENPNEVNQFFMDKKMGLAMSNPDMYAFFLTLGIGNTPTYKEHLNILEDSDYFQKRNQVMRTLSDLV